METGDLARDEYLQSMRLMAWERAKGELRSIGHASYSAGDNARGQRMETYRKLLREFLFAVDSQGLIE